MPPRSIDWPQFADVEVSRLLFDEQNPRVPDGTSGQRQAMLALAKHQGAKLMGLASHIAEHGLNPAQRFIVVPVGRSYRVLDGNRRLCALKALDSPVAFTNLSKTRVARLGQLGTSAAIPHAVPAVIYRDPAQAEPWIRLTHLDQRSGEGLSRWSAQQKARHEERLGGARPPALQVLDFVREAGTLSAKTQALADGGTFPMTMIDRLLESKDARPILKLKVEDGQVKTDVPREEALKGLTRYIEDIAAKTVTSRKLNTSVEIVDYLKKYKAADLPNVALTLTEAVALAEAPARATGSSKRAKRRDRSASSKRPFIIPAETQLEVGIPRVHDMYLELKRLPVDELWNAGGALLRVFVEMSISIYLRRNSLPLKGKEYWRPNWNTAKAHMIDKGVLDQATLNKVEQAIFDTNTGFATLNAIVHDPEFTYTGNDLKALWGRLEPVLRAIWRVP